MATKNISPAGSLKGWNFVTWVVKNKDSLKLIVSGAAGLATAFIANLNPVLAGALGTLVAAVTKMILDTIDFWVTEVKLG
jgi:ammonia channel protein AmtB